MASDPKIVQYVEELDLLIIRDGEKLYHIDGNVIAGMWKAYAEGHGIDYDICEGCECVDPETVVPLEDYRSMEQTVHKLTQAIAEAAPRWIPTTERLPDVGVYVLVCTKQKSGQIIERIGVYSGTSYGWSTGGATRDVVAWMPLPKVYKEDKPNDEERYGEYVKVVRCKDCMHWDNHDGGERCLNEIYLSWAKPNNFCIYGVKKDEVEE